MLLVLLVYGCNSVDKHEQALRIINYFKDNPSQLQEYQQKVIIPRGKDVFIYVLDSLQIGFYLVNFDTKSPDALQISSHTIRKIDSLLVKKNVTHLTKFKKILLKTAFDNLSLMDYLDIRSVNSCGQNKECCTEFILYDGTKINYLCNHYNSVDEFKNKFSSEVNVVDNNWIYYLREN